MFCGGPFTDALREKSANGEKDVKKAVNGAGGSHIILPGYLIPPAMGMVDMQTRYFFFCGFLLAGITTFFGPLWD